MTKTASQKRRARQAKQAQNQQVKNNARPNRNRQKRPNRSRNNVLGAAGHALSNFVGSGNIPYAVGSGLSRLFGQGDYKISSNSLFSGGIPSFGSLESPMRFKHKELIGNVSTSTGFSVSNRLQINPGLLAPIISQFSNSFTMYKFHGLVFMFNSTSANSIGSTNTALGVTGMVVNYDPTAANFSTRESAEEYTGAQAATPGTNLILPVECKPQTTMFEKRFIRTTSGTPPGKTLPECDVGVFQFFSDGAQAVSSAGELWVAYDVEFFLPKFDGNVGAYTDFYYGGSTTTTSSVWSGQITSASKYTSMSQDGTLTFNTLGGYRVYSALQLTSALATTFSPTGTNMDPFTTNIAAPETGISSQNKSCYLSVTVTKVGATLTAGLSSVRNHVRLLIVKEPIVTMSMSVEGQLNELRNKLAALQHALELQPMEQIPLLQATRATHETLDEEDIIAQ